MKVRISEADAFELRVHLRDGDTRLRLQFAGRALAALRLTPEQSHRVLELFAHELDIALRESGCGEVFES